MISLSSLFYDFVKNNNEGALSLAGAPATKACRRGTPAIGLEIVQRKALRMAVTET